MASSEKFWTVSMSFTSLLMHRSRLTGVRAVGRSQKLIDLLLRTGGIVEDWVIIPGPQQPAVKSIGTQIDLPVAKSRAASISLLYTERATPNSPMMIGLVSIPAIPKLSTYCARLRSQPRYTCRSMKSALESQMAGRVSITRGSPMRAGCGPCGQKIRPRSARLGPRKGSSLGWFRCSR